MIIWALTYINSQKRNLNKNRHMNVYFGRLLSTRLAAKYPKLANLFKCELFPSYSEH